MLHCIQNLSDPLLSLIKDDPVRPDIPLEFRVSQDTEVFVLLDSDDSVMPRPAAVVCVAYRPIVPSSVTELMIRPAVTSSVAVFYTIWSYQRGRAFELIRQSRRDIESRHSHITEFVTLSPQTDMARRFHLNNGARVLRVNSDSVNYQYP